MHDDGHIHMGTAQVNTTPMDPKGAGVFVGMAIWFMTSMLFGITTAMRFFIELYAVVFKRKRLHWSRYVAW
ncbi:hypothetical protein, partial [Comamonas thiooxydans]|uniref:hypothetical protein n=1 Tax=Comamonas thiooxydans TaxID=363952 RepID=UPI00054F9603